MTSTTHSSSTDHTALTQRCPGWATAVAHPNIALVKYWGKRDESLILPMTDSLSMTLDIFPTTTTVTVDPARTVDEVLLDGGPAPAAVRERIVRFLDLVRRLSCTSTAALVQTTNTVPIGAGLASSASGFAALALAAATAYELRLDRQELTRLARRGSGSACRSIHGGFVWWHAGHGTGDRGDASSYAEQIDTPDFDPAMVITVVDAGPKPIPSRDAMHRTMNSSPLYRAWADTCATHITEIRSALAHGDLDRIGRIAEHNALGMHATMLGAYPPIRYLAPGSVTVLDAIAALRHRGLTVYATIDAGPNVVALCPDSEATRVAAALSAASESVRTFIARPGPGARLLPGGHR
nr:diphosphomevalonate decarboxylase [Nocardia brasiliensis]